MIINGFALYKVIETANGLALINALDKSNRPDVVELVVADARTCAEYMLRYIHARADGAAGKTMAEAHRQALEGAVVVKKWETQ